MLKKILISIILCFSFVLTGCDKVQSSQKTVIQFSSWGSQSEVAVINDLITDFEAENPHIKIDFLHIPQNYFQKLHLLFASNLAPDVIFINNIYSPIYIKAGLFDDVSNLIDKSDYFKVSVDDFSYGGELYAVPRDVSNLVLFYNKDIFDKANLPYPKSSMNMVDLAKISSQLKQKGYYSLNYEDMSLFWLYYAAALGGGVLSDDKKEEIFTSQKTITALEYYSDFINKYHYIPTKSQKASKTSAQMFMNGEIAMYLSGRWMVPKFREMIKFDWDVVEFPHNRANKLYVDASGWAVSRNSKHKKEATAFVKFLASKNSIEKFTKSGLIIPARKDVAYSEVFMSTDLKPKNSKIFVDMLNNAKPTPTNENYQRIDDILAEHLEPVFNGSKKTKEIMTKRLKKQLDELVK
ncbi:MAG: sugar ABC transporter substrate-binding protein [Candidatus Gastranaerophilales bacterium]|nr:sugar ABC transporter substrate-binding protein [Candidatus Gastranaerophilales bacterium]